MPRIPLPTVESTCRRPAPADGTRGRRRARSRLGAAGVVVTVLLVGCGTSTGPETATPPDEGDTQTDQPAAEQPAAAADSALYDVSARTVDGADWDAADLAGRPAVLWFWAPWCPTCRAQVSGVGELARTHGDDVAVVGVGAQDEAAAIAEFAATVDPSVTNVSDVDGAVWRHFEVTAQSTYLVLDAEGRVRGQGYLDEGELATLVDDLVDQQSDQQG